MPKLPTNVREIGIVLRTKKCEKGRKLYFDYADIQNHRGILIHNFNAQFWVHYFRSGIGLVSVTCFSQPASAEGSVLPSKCRTIDGSYEYQWFTHDLTKRYFQKVKAELYLNKLSKYFVQQVNTKLVSPYSFFSEEKKIKEPYKFVRGSLECLRDILKLAFLVFEGIKQKTDSSEKFRFNSSMTVEKFRFNSSMTFTCGNLRNDPFYLDFRNEIGEATPREKVAAKFHLINWLNKQRYKGEWITKTLKLD